MAKKPDLFDNPDRVKSIFDKDQNRWTVDDYRSVMGDARVQGMRNFTLDILIRYLVESPAFLSLSPRATKLFIACCNATWVNGDDSKRRPGGRDNGNRFDATKEDRPDLDTAPFYCTYNYAKAFGVGTSKQIAAAFRELKAFGFIKQKGVSRRNYPNVYEHSSEYKALTWDDINRIKSELKLNKGVK